MSNINLRLYADQVYGLSSIFFNEYLTQSIEKEDFISKFQNGLVKFQNIATKKELIIHPTISISNLMLNSLEVNVPDENGNLVIDIEGLKSSILLSEINENNLKEIMINKRKKLKEKFIKDIFNKITKKSESSSFIEGLIENIIQKVINGLKIKIKNIEISVKFDKTEFVIKMDCLDLIIENKELKIDFINLSITDKENMVEENFIDKFDINLKLIIANNESNGNENENNNEVSKPFCELKIDSKNLKVNLSRKIVKSVFDIVNLFRDIKYNQLYYRYKKLIQFHRPKFDKNNKNYKSLWLYAIKTVIKLRKFACFDNFDIFELLNSTQKRLIQNGENPENLLLPSDICILGSTRNEVEQKILDSKESLANKFFSFFSSNTEEKTLTDEEKEMLEDGFKQENLEKYLIKGKFEDDNNEKEIIKKIKKFLSNYEININIGKITIIFNNENIKTEGSNENIDNFYLNDFYFELKYNDSKYNFNINAKDMGKDENLSFSGNDEKYLIKFTYDTMNNLNFYFDKEHIEIPENILYQILCYTLYIVMNIIYFYQRSIFHKTKNIENKNINKVNRVNKISVLNMPFLTVIKSDNNKVNVNISDYSWTSDLISFTVKIKDSYRIILDDYQFKISIDDKDKKYSINLEKPLNINIDKKIIESSTLNFININNSIFSEKFLYKSDKLFNFTFTKYINNLKILELFNNNVNIFINELNFAIKDNEYDSIIKLKKHNFQYQNKNLAISSDDIFISIDLLSVMPIIKAIQSYKYKIQHSYFNYQFNNIINELIKSFKLDINHFEGYLYMDSKKYYFDTVINGIKGYTDSSNNEINNCQIKDIKMNIYYMSLLTKILDSQNIKLDIRLNSNSNIAFKLNVESPIISFLFILYNYKLINEIIKYFLKLKVIYEIKMTNIKTEIFRKLDEEKESDLSINITNYTRKKDDNKEIDLIYLEKYGLTYNLENYTNIILSVKGKNLVFFESQRDISYLFYSLFGLKDDEGNKEYFFNLFNSLDLEVDLKQIKNDFHLGRDYEMPFFDVYFNDLLLKLNIIRKKITNLNLGFNEFQVNYYEYNKSANENKAIPIIDYNIKNINNKNKTSLSNSGKKQIEVKKDNNNKIDINISKLHFLFKKDIILSIFYFFKDLSIDELLFNYLKKQKEKSNNTPYINDTNYNIQILLSEIQFEIPINYFNQNNCIYIYLNQIDFTYIKTVDDLIKDHRIRISLNNLIVQNNNRKILYTKDEYLLFVMSIKDNEELSIISNSLFNTLIINFSNKDIILLYKIIFDIKKINQIIIPKNELNAILGKGRLFHYNSSSINEDKITNNVDDINYNNIFIKIFNKIESIVLEINIESINITLLEDSITNDGISSNNYYYPFLNINLNKAMLNYELNKNINENIPFIKLSSNHYFLLSYFNEIYKAWEPVIEDTIINFDYILKSEKNKLVDNFTFEVNKLILNISDLYINTLLVNLNSWLHKLTTQINYLKMSKNQNAIVKSKSKINDNQILKYIIHNCTDLDLNMTYKDQKYQINSNNKLNVNYEDDDSFGINNNLFNFIIFEFILNKSNTNKIILYAGEIGIRKYKIILDNKEREIYIQIKIEKNKCINIFIYNPIILKNKTNYLFEINLSENSTPSAKLLLFPNSEVGLPINFISNEKAEFNMTLKDEKNIDKSNSLKDLLKLGDLIPNNSDEKIIKDIIFKENNISLLLISKLKSEKLTSIKISHKYCIINCLPCSLFISQNPEENDSNENIEIKRNFLYYIDDTSILTEHSSIKLKIKIAENYFFSKLSLMRKESKIKLIKFTSINNKELLTLPIIIHEINNIKTIVIYSEYILYNNSGIDLNISSQDENNHNHFYNVENCINLISSEISNSDTDKYICIKSKKNIFTITYINYTEISEEPYYEFSLNLEDKAKNLKFNYDLLINKKTSYFYCENDENNFINKINEEFPPITIYRIIPKYNIIDLTSSKNILEKSVNIILKKNRQYFMGMGIKSIEELKNRNNYYMFESLTINSLYTICLKDNLYNVEVRKSRKGGYKDVYIFDNNLNHSQVVVENKTNYEICLKQKKFEKFKQEIKKNEKQILKIYDQTSHNFSVQIDNKLYFFDLNEIGDKQIKNNLYLNIEKNSNSKKLIFYSKDLKEDDSFIKSKSVLDLPKIGYNNLKINFHSNRYTKINIILNQINISIIGQSDNNGNKNKLNEYERKEIALLFINDFQCGIKLSKSKKHILSHNNLFDIKLNTKISKCEIYNLLMNNSNSSCLFTNSSSPLINIYSEINYDLDKNRIRVLELINNIGDIKLNVAPIILQEIYNFIKNIISNYNSNNKKVDSLFLTKNSRINIINSSYNYHPLSILIDQITISEIKIRFKLKKEGMETLPSLIIEYINYLKCFPFFAIDKETKTILSEISLQGPFKDIKVLLDKIKLRIIGELSKEIVIKVLHPANNEIKDIINNMIGFDNKSNQKNNNNNKDENIFRIKNKRIFLGKNKFYTKYNKNEQIVLHKLKNDFDLYSNKYLIGIFCIKNNGMILFNDCLLYINDSNDKKFFIYSSIKDIKIEKNKIEIIYNESGTKEENILFEFKDESEAQNIYKFLISFI